MVVECSGAVTLVPNWDVIIAGGDGVDATDINSPAAVPKPRIKTKINIVST